MLAPSYLSDVDRQRLVYINQRLLGKNTPEEAVELREEQTKIIGKRKELPECTYEELQELRAQLFDQYQKHAAIGSKQTGTIAQYIRQVEFREMAFANQPTDQLSSASKDAPDAAPVRSKTRVSSRSSTYNWTIDVD
jgi:hypothetical protein